MRKEHDIANVRKNIHLIKSPAARVTVEEDSDSEMEEGEKMMETN